MSSPRAYLAIDLGAESGRAIAGVFAGGRVTLHELHRFNHRPIALPSGLHWDLPALWNGVLDGLRRAAQWSAENNIPLASVGVDSWGVDFALVGVSGELYGLPHAYRDPLNEPAFEKALAALGREKLYEITGIQFLPFNSLFQLVARHTAEPALLHRAHRLLFMCDLMHFLLTGRMLNEATIASSSQMVGAESGAWAGGLLEALGLPKQFLGPIAPPGTLLGNVRPDVAAHVGLRNPLPVILPAGHDSACAFAAVPADADSSWCCISSGTWSVFGAELDAPVLTPEARDAPFTNERGVGGTIRFLNNLPGLWLLQECRREFGSAGDALTYDQLIAQAVQSEPLRTLVRPADPVFLSPGHMLDRIRAFAQRTGQPPPESPAQFARCCLESLALSYRGALAQLEGVLNRRFDVIHIVGGGSRNALLNQMTADATGRRVIAGPHEATALGNLLVQALGDGAIDDRHEIRRIVAASVELRAFTPAPHVDWHAASAKFDAFR